MKKLFSFYNLYFIFMNAAFTLMTMCILVRLVGKPDSFYAWIGFISIMFFAADKIADLNRKEIKEMRDDWK